MSPTTYTELDQIKEQFIQAWQDGEEPTLSDYKSRYPLYAAELTEFIMDFAEISVLPFDQEEPSREAEQAMLRGLSASQAKARTIADRLREIGKSEDDLAKIIRAHFLLIATFNRAYVDRVPPSFWNLLAEGLQVTIKQCRQMLAPRGLSFRKQNPQNPEPRLFADIIEELHQKNLIGGDDYEFWKGEIAKS